MDEKKERILVAAEKIFTRFGIRKTTMDEIARAARMGKSTLYYYFKSKDEIFAEVISKDSIYFKQRLQEAMTRASTPQEKIGAYVLTRMQHLQELSNYYTTLTDEYLEQYAFVERARRDFTEYEIATLTDLIREGIDQGVFEVDDAAATARNFAIALKGLEYPLLLKAVNGDIAQECGQMLNILFKGIEIR
ncbi:MAG: TetR/AcrR family transcriptional regulator [Candidatus Neomarinimicrobiota bacterium]